jgi:hypothetical protein
MLRVNYSSSVDLGEVLDVIPELAMRLATVPR